MNPKPEVYLFGQVLGTHSFLLDGGFLQPDEYAEIGAQYFLPGGETGTAATVPDSLEDFVSMTMRMVNLTIHDEQIVKTRKVLTLEQYRDVRARDLATKHFLTGLTEMFTHFFFGMMDNGLLKRDDPAMLAFAYTAPISALIHLCDREPEKTEDAIRKIEAFSRHFIATGGVK